MYGCGDTGGDAIAEQFGDGHGHREVVVHDTEDVRQYTRVSHDPRTLPLGLHEAQDRHTHRRMSSLDAAAWRWPETSSLPTIVSSVGLSRT
jgi:hypothetical protein